MLKLVYKNTADTEYNIKLKPARIHPRNVIPTILTDTWNGIISKVQEVRYDGYYVEFNVNNDELNEVNLLQSVDYIRIIDQLQGIDHIADKTSPENFKYNEPENIPIGNSWKVSFIYRTNRTVETKVIPAGTTSNYLSVSGNTYYSEFDTVYVSVPVEQIFEKNETNQEILIKSTYNVGKSIIFYNTPQVISNLKNDLNEFSNPSINGVSIYKYELIEDTLLGEDLQKLVLNCYTDIDVQLPVLSLSAVNTVNVSFDNGTSVEAEAFTTPFAMAEITEDTETETTTDSDDVKILDYANTRIIKRLKFFLTRSDANDLKRLFEVAQTININGSITVLENRIVSYEDLEDGLIKVVTDCLISSVVNFPSTI